MVTLADLISSSNKTETKISDFAIAASQTGNVLSSDSKTNLAAHAAVLANPNDVLKTFGVVNSELEATTTSSTLDRLLSEKASANSVAMGSAWQGILADTNTTPEEKYKYWQAQVAAIEFPGSKSIPKIVSEEAAVEPAPEIDREELVNTMLSRHIQAQDETDMYNAWVEDVKRTTFNMKDRAWWDTTLDFVEMVIPFMESAAQTKVRMLLGSDDPNTRLTGFFLLGENYEGIAQKMRFMSAEEKMAFGKKVIEVVKQGGGSITPRQNQLVAIKQLTEALDSGTNVDRVLDNAFSVLDLATFVMGPLKAIFKGGGAAAKAARGAAAEARMAQAEADVGTAVEEVLTEAQKKVIPRSELDNIIEGSKGFDKATGDEIATARNEIGFGLDEGLNVDEIIARSTVFDKFTKSELDEFKAIFNSPVARQTAPLKDSTIESIRAIVLDKVIGNLEQLDVLPATKFGDLRQAVTAAINRASVLDAKAMSKEVVSATRRFLRENELPKIEPKLADKLKRQIQVESEAARLADRTEVDMNSLSQTFATSNPSKARNLNALMEADETGSVAKSTYGASKDEAIANDRGFEVGNTDGSVRNKVEMDEAGPNPEVSLVGKINATSGRKEFTEAEKAGMRNAAKDFFDNVKGLTSRTAMATIDNVDVAVGKSMEETPGGVRFDMVYGPKDGGIENAAEAVRNMLVAGAKYGLRPDEIEVLELASNGRYVPVKGVPTARGNYLIRVKHEYQFSPGDVIGWSGLRNNWFLNMFDFRNSFNSARSGTILENLVPSFHRINTVLYNSGIIAADRTAKISQDLLKGLVTYKKAYDKLDKTEKAAIELYIVEANEKGIPFSWTGLEARGFSEESIDALSKWKDVTDSVWHLENMDFNRSLNARGWSLFLDPTTDTNLIAKKIGKDAASKVKVYDTTSNSFVTLSKSEIEELYKADGGVAELKYPKEFEDDVITHVLVRNNESGYLSRIRDADHNLPYRDGYYPIRHEANIFIRETVRVKGGKTITRTIGTADTVEDAEVAIARLEKNISTKKKGSVTYKATPDMRAGSAEAEEARWESVVSSGRSGQRIRGEGLFDFSGDLNVKNTHIEQPAAAVERSIRSIAYRTGWRNYFEAHKARWVANNKELLGGRNQFPNRLEELEGNVDVRVPSSKIKDAKATWRHIKAMEDGYINLLDDHAKRFFNAMADVSSRKKSFKFMEKYARAAGKAEPTAAVRRTAFKFQIAAHPLRALPMNASQAIPYFVAFNPLGVFKITSQMVALDAMAMGVDEAATIIQRIGAAATGWTVEEARMVKKFWEDSGFEAAVDANSMVRDNLASIVDKSVAAKVGRVANTPFAVGQKVGYNLGETILMKSVWLSELDKLRAAKVKIDAGVLEELNARVRHLTGDMNKGGEMPYQENALSVAMQFIQARHKISSQFLWNHPGLSQMDNWKLRFGYIATYGLGTNWASDLAMNALGVKDPETQELIEGGIFNLALNWTLSQMFGEESRVDFSENFRLVEAPDFFKMWEAALTSGLGDMFSNSPAGGLLFGDSARLTAVFKQMARPFTVDDSRKLEETLLLGQKMLEMMSGASAYFKAKWAFETGKSKSASGRVYDENVNSIEAFFMAAGFKTIDEYHAIDLNETEYIASEKYKKDITIWVNETSRWLSSKGLDNNSREFLLDAMSEAQRVWGNKPIYMKEILSQIKAKYLRGEHTVFRDIVKLAGITDPSQLENSLRLSNMTEEQKNVIRTFANALPK